MKWLMRILGKGKKNRAGFTLIELMVVVIIVGILAAAAVPIYRFAVRKAYMSEAKAALGTIRAAELVYHSEHKKFLAVGQGDIGNPETGVDTDGGVMGKFGLGIDVTNNTWFSDANCFMVTSASDDVFVAACSSTNGHSDVVKHNIYVTLNQAGVWGYPTTDPCPAVGG